MSLPRGFVLAGAVVALVASVAMVAVAIAFRVDASETKARALRLYGARLAVARAEERLGGTDLQDAIAAAQKANEIAVRVGHATRRMVGLLDGAHDTVEELVRSSGRGARNAVFAQERVRLLRRILTAIGGYQVGATRYAALTNAALKDILRALRRTNASFPPEVPP